jgi:hypothetical protein
VSVALFCLSFFAFSFEQQSSAHTTFI